MWRARTSIARSSPKPSPEFPRREGRIRSAISNLAFGVLLLAGCATVDQEFDQARNSWQGASYDQVLARWGPPARSATLADGRQTHTWTSQEAPLRAPGPSVGVGVFGGGGGGGVGIGVGFPFGTTVNPASCERTLTFKDGQLVEQSWAGDPAYCRYFKRSS
jgi:hypothetical protein